MIGARNDGRPFWTWPTVILCAFFAEVVPVIPGLPAPALAASTVSAESAPASADLDRTILPFLAPQKAPPSAPIFGLQKEGNWKAAAAEIPRLKDKLLIGEVLA